MISVEMFSKCIYCNESAFTSKFNAWVYIRGRQEAMYL